MLHDQLIRHQTENSRPTWQHVSRDYDVIASARCSAMSRYTARTADADTLVSRHGQSSSRQRKHASNVKSKRPTFIQNGPKIAPFLYALTSSNNNRFPKFFQCQSQEKIYTNTITKDLTTNTTLNRRHHQQ